MELDVSCCHYCDSEIHNEKDAYYYEPAGIVVCEECPQLLLNAPIEEESDTEMEDLMSSMTIS